MFIKKASGYNKSCSHALLLLLLWMDTGVVGVTMYIVRGQVSKVTER